jgi:hypothetical protein
MENTYKNITIEDQIIKEHIIKYPYIQFQDIVKLLFQRYFGPGHMIKSSKSSYAYLQEEINNILLDNNSTLLEDIGGEYVRIYLSEYVRQNKDLKLLNKYFVKSANTITPKTNNFKEVLESIKHLDNINFLDNYDFTPTHHSNIYNEYYSPHYRVINKKYVKELIK